MANGGSDSERQLQITLVERRIDNWGESPLTNTTLTVGGNRKVRAKHIEPGVGSTGNICDRPERRSLTKRG
jgi:hypothetical protein